MVNKHEQSSTNEEKATYSVALSYAGEDREYVEAVYSELRKRGVSVFYDRDPDIETEMWGHSLPGYLQNIFGKGRASYCVIFVTDIYQQKAFTTHELESALSQGVLSGKRDYILPVMLQGDELPEQLNPTTKYLDARNNRITPQELAQSIAAKVQPPSGEVVVESVPQTVSPAVNIRLPRIPTIEHDPSSDPDYVVDSLVDELVKRGELLKDRGIQVSLVNRNGERIVRVRSGNKKIYNLAIWLGGMTGDDDISFYQWTDRRFDRKAMHAFGGIEWSQEKDSYVINLMDVSLLKPVGVGKVLLTTSELLELLWENLVEHIEREYEGN